MTEKSSKNKAIDIANKIRDIETINSLLEWDLETNVSIEGQKFRGRQISTLQFLKRKFLKDEKNLEIINQILNDEEENDNNLVDIISSIKEEVETITKISSNEEKDIHINTNESLIAWQKAKKENDFNIWKPKLENLINSYKKKTEKIKDLNQTNYEVIFQENEPEFSLEEIDNIFNKLKEFLIPLFNKIKRKKQPSYNNILNKKIKKEEQLKFSKLILEKMGFNFDAGRLDTSIHPFTMNCGENDVRLTTTLTERDFFDGVYSTIHEFGHGLYEQGMHRKYEGTILANSPSSSLHEAIARLFENQIGKNEFFISWFTNILKNNFQEFKNLNKETLHIAINKVSPITIRQSSDELSYDIHILIRYEIEKELFNNNITVEQIPEIWKQKTKDYFNIKISSDGEGCMHDIHWAEGMFGYFPTYTLGNIYASQLLNAYEKFNPNIYNDISKGNFIPFISWLDVNIFRKGYTKSASSIIEEATGEKINVDYYISYLENKFKKLYNL